MKMKKTFKTPYQEKKEAKENQIYNEYLKAVADPSASRTAVRDFLMEKHNIGSTATFYAILERVKTRISL